MTVTAVAAALAVDAADGLWRDPPVLPAKWLYDERGSKLFDEITRLTEYYPTRREVAILRSHAADIARLTTVTSIVEFGSGTSTKTRILLDAFGSGAARRLIYAPVDVSAEILAGSASTLAADYPGLDVVPLVADFTEPNLRLPDSQGARLVVFLGGTIGNFDSTERAEFLAALAAALGDGDYFLLGADLIKDTGRIVAAYNDNRGVTADFNKNMIEVLRAGLNATGLYADDFDHIARWNPTHHRIEMWLRARREIRAHLSVLNREWHLRAGAEIRTEISTKFDPADLTAELAAAGLHSVADWTDPAGDFMLTLRQRAASHR